MSRLSISTAEQLLGSRGYARGSLRQSFSLHTYKPDFYLPAMWRGPNCDDASGDPCTDGVDAETATDLGAFGADVSDTAEATPPQYDASGINGYPALLFDGADEGLFSSASADFAVLGEATAFTVFQSDRTTTTNADVLWSLENSGSQINLWLAMNRTTNKMEIAHGNANVGTGSLDHDNNAHIYCIRRSGSSGDWTVKGWMDGQLDTDTSGIATNPAGGTPNFHLGFQASAWRYAGHIGVVWIKKAALSARQINRIGRRLARDYGLSWTTITL